VVGAKKRIDRTLDEEEAAAVKKVQTMALAWDNLEDLLEGLKLANYYQVTLTLRGAEARELLPGGCVGGWVGGWVGRKVGR
jgi:hypothetical protein